MCNLKKYLACCHCLMRNLVNLLSYSVFIKGIHFARSTDFLLPVTVSCTIEHCSVYIRFAVLCAGEPGREDCHHYV